MLNQHNQIFEELYKLLNNRLKSGVITSVEIKQVILEDYIKYEAEIQTCIALDYFKFTITAQNNNDLVIQIIQKLQDINSILHDYYEKKIQFNKDEVSKTIKLLQDKEQYLFSLETTNNKFENANLDYSYFQGKLAYFTKMPNAFDLDNPTYTSMTNPEQIHYRNGYNEASKEDVYSNNKVST
jgi:hypothetical protein